MNIVISGTVGVGKTTIMEALQEEISRLPINYDSHFFKEIVGVENPFLDLYYQSPSEYAFLIQINFLLERFKNALHFDGEDKKVIRFYDRHFLDDFIWTNMKPIQESMSSFQFQTYKIINRELATKLLDNSKVDYLFLLKADFDTVIERIKNRGRDEEKEVDLNYWKELYHIYYETDFIQKYLKDHVKHLITIETMNKSPKQVAKEILSLIEFN